VIWASKILKARGVATAADLGCGRFRNLKILQSHFREVTCVDTALQCCRISGSFPKRKGLRLLTVEQFETARRKYDAIFLISVLHIIPRSSIRKSLIRLAGRKLRKGGFLIVDIPSGEAYYRQRCTNENKYRDGWVMGRGGVRTFYKNFSKRAADRSVTSAGRFRLFVKGSFSRHIVAIWQTA
jgi:hypothetical protein